MIAIETNILVYSHRADSTWHGLASKAVRELAEGRASWAIPWTCLHEFYAIVTHPRIYSPASTPEEAVSQIEAWLESPSVVLLSESAAYWEVLLGVLETSRVVGPRIHDARVAALCLTHGVSELWSADRDFSRFRGLSVTNPLADQ